MGRVPADWISRIRPLRITVSGALAASALVAAGCSYSPSPFPVEQEVGTRPAAWTPAGVVEVDLTGYRLNTRPDHRAAAALQVSPLENPPFTQEPAVAWGDTFTATDPKIVVRPREGYTGGVESVIVYEQNGLGPAGHYGNVNFATGLTDLPGPQARPAPPGEIPTATLFASARPVPRTGPGFGSITTMLDARQSTGSSLAYSWDVDGDGSFGDDPSGGRAGMPEGTAIVPEEGIRRASVVGRIEVGVRVTAAGGGQDTARLVLPIWDQGAGGGFAFRAGAEQRIQPEVESLQDNRFVPDAVHFACLDIGDDGSWDDAPIETFPVFGLQDRWSFAGNWLVSMPVGRTRVAIAYFREALPAPDCSANGALLSVSRFLVTSEADGGISGGVTPWAREFERGAAAPRAARRPQRYRARAPLGVRGGRVLAVGRMTSGASFAWDGLVSAGRFTFPMPARGGGAARPPALAQFSRGTFASRSDMTIGSAPRLKAPPIMVGTTIMLVRGSRGGLGCFRIERTTDRTTWTLLGGTGGMRRLDMTLTGPPTGLRAMNALERRRSLLPSRARYAVTAMPRSAPRGVPSACRGLRGALRRAAAAR